ncbi:hypothetical protein Emag_003884 [Eimeria magna]
MASSRAAAAPAAAAPAAAAEAAQAVEVQGLVELQVGPSVFYATRRTLSKCPVLRRMLGLHDRRNASCSAEVEEGGPPRGPLPTGAPITATPRLLLDCEPQVFALVLAYLRTGEIDKTCLVGSRGPRPNPGGPSSSGVSELSLRHEFRLLQLPWPRRCMRCGSLYNHDLYVQLGRGRGTGCDEAEPVGEEELPVCYIHPGRLRPSARQGGPPLFTCCGREEGDLGCQVARHCSALDTAASQEQQQQQQQQQQGKIESSFRGADTPQNQALSGCLKEETAAAAAAGASQEAGWQQQLQQQQQQQEHEQHEPCWLSRPSFPRACIAGGDSLLCYPAYPCEAPRLLRPDRAAGQGQQQRQPQQPKGELALPYNLPPPQRYFIEGQGAPYCAAAAAAAAAAQGAAGMHGLCPEGLWPCGLTRLQQQQQQQLQQQQQQLLLCPFYCPYGGLTCWDFGPLQVPAEPIGALEGPQGPQGPPGPPWLVDGDAVHTNRRGGPRQQRPPWGPQKCRRDSCLRAPRASCGAGSGDIEDVQQLPEVLELALNEGAPNGSRRGPRFCLKEDQGSEREQRGAAEAQEEEGSLSDTATPAAATAATTAAATAAAAAGQLDAGEGLVEGDEQRGLERCARGPAESCRASTEASVKQQQQQQQQQQGSDSEEAALEVRSPSVCSRSSSIASPRHHHQQQQQQQEQQQQQQRMKSRANTNKTQSPNPLFKTRMCHLFKNGLCHQFAHALHELRATADLYKTGLCVFWASGFCKAGSLCRHAHGEAEVRRKVAEECPVRSLPCSSIMASWSLQQQQRQQQEEEEQQQEKEQQEQQQEGQAQQQQLSPSSCSALVA